MSPLVWHVWQGLSKEEQRGLWPKGAFWTSLQAAVRMPGGIHGCLVHEGASCTMWATSIDYLDVIERSAYSVCPKAAMKRHRRVRREPCDEGYVWGLHVRLMTQGLFTSTATFGIWPSQCNLVFKLFSVCFVFVFLYKVQSMKKFLSFQNWQIKDVTKQDPFGFLVDVAPSSLQNAGNSLPTMPALDKSWSVP